MLTSLLILATVVTTAITTPVVIPSGGPNPTQVSIQSITYGGSGCPQGSIGQFLSSDLSSFTLMFDSFNAQTGPGVAPLAARTACQINLSLKYPQGFQYSVLSTVFRGYVDLDSGVNGTLSALYYFSGPNQNSVTTSTNFRGPEIDNYDVSSAVGFTSVVWSPCGANWPLNLKTSVAVASEDPEAEGFIENDTIDGNIQFVTGIQWRSC